VRLDPQSGGPTTFNISVRRIRVGELDAGGAPEESLGYPLVQMHNDDRVQPGLILGRKEKQHARAPLWSVDMGVSNPRISEP
jgi:hypothetical protein